MVKAYFALEALGASIFKNAPRYKADLRAQSILEMTTKYLPQKKRWENVLLCSFDKIELPYSKEM